MNRIHFISPDRYFHIVMASHLDENVVSLIRREFDLWIGYSLLTPNTSVLIFDTLSSMFFYSTLSYSLVYTNN